MTRHYSPSQLRTWLRCPRQWYWRYVRDVIAPPSAAQIVGSAVHVPAAEYHRRGLGLPVWSSETARLALGEDEAADMVKQAFVARVDQVPWDDEEEPRGAAFDRAVALSRHYLATVAPSCGRPIAVERRIEVAPEGEDWSIVAVPDLVTASSDGAILIRDLKTSAKAPGGKTRSIVVAQEHRRQIAAYRYAWRAIDPSATVGGAIDYVWSSKHVAATSDTAPVEIYGGDEELLFDQLRTMHAQITAGTFIRNTDSWGCNPRWCGYWSRCLRSNRDRE